MDGDLALAVEEVERRPRRSSVSNLSRRANSLGCLVASHGRTALGVESWSLMLMLMGVLVFSMIEGVMVLLISFSLLVY